MANSFTYIEYDTLRGRQAMNFREMETLHNLTMGKMLMLVLLAASFSFAQNKTTNYVDTRTSLQVIEDRAALNNYGRSKYKKFVLNVPKLVDYGIYQINVKHSLSILAYEASDKGLVNYFSDAVACVPDFYYNPDKSVYENENMNNIITANKYKAFNDAVSKLVTYIDDDIYKNMESKKGR